MESIDALPPLPETSSQYDELKIQIKKEIISFGKNFENDAFFVAAYMLERGIPREHLNDEMDKANFQQIQSLYMIKALADREKEQAQNNSDIIEPQPNTKNE